MTLYGPDLSNNNWSSKGEIAAWLDNCFHREGFSWMEHKVSEGNYYKDPYWSTVRDWCKTNGIPCIGYHYVTTNNPTQQAAQFVANGGGAYCMFDVENNSGDIAQFWAVLAAFKAAGIQVTLSYIPHWYWQNVGSPNLVGVPGLISSNYFGRGTYASTEYVAAGGDTGPGWKGYGGVNPVIWQFTDGAIISGKSVDCNAFKGGLVQLQELIQGFTVDPTLAQILAIVQDIQAKTNDNQVQLRGPGLKGWPQLGDLTVVDALGKIKTKAGA